MQTNTVILSGANRSPTEICEVEESLLNDKRSFDSVRALGSHELRSG